MVMYSTPALDFSTFPESDGAPVAETIYHLYQITDLQFAARHLLASRGISDYAVGGNQFLYYNQHYGLDHCAPDVYIALGVPPGPRATWRTWVEGKCPDIVMEITSPSTAREDQDKIALYERLGAQEYYIHDPLRETTPAFTAYQRQGKRLLRAGLLPSGGIMSPLLRVELRPVGQYLRIIDPASGEPLLVPDEVWDAWLDEQAAHRQTQERLGHVEAAWRAVETRLLAEERARAAAEARARDEERARLAAEARAREEEQARLAAEERATAAEARSRDEERARLAAEARAAAAAVELDRLRADLARRPGSDQQA